MRVEQCPCCGRDPKDKELWEVMRSLLWDWGGFFNPGGAEYFKGSRRIQISACCTWCDLKTVADTMRANSWRIGD